MGFIPSFFLADYYFFSLNWMLLWS